MTAPTVERFGPDVSIDSLVEAIDRDGVAMVTDAIDPGLLAALNREFDVLIDGARPGTPNGTPAASPAADQPSAFSTCRRLAASSRTIRLTTSNPSWLFMRVLLARRDFRRDDMRRRGRTPPGQAGARPRGTGPSDAGTGSRTGSPVANRSGSAAHPR